MMEIETVLAEGVIEDDATTGQVELESGLQGTHLREFEPLNKLLKILPHRAQKGLFTVEVRYSCIDVCDEYIAVGSNIGVVFLYDRKKETLQRLNTANKNDSISCIKMQASLDHMVAAGLSSGLLVVFQLPSILPGRNKQLQRYDVPDMHTTLISSLAWSANGMKIFSGDQNGVVCYTEFDYSQKQTKSAIILKEGYEIVQLCYAHKTLLVSSKLRSILHTIEENKTIQIGQRERKCLGRFGAAFTNQICKPADAVIYASRPGMRIWTANIHGVVNNTFIFKDLLAMKHPDIALLSSSVIIRSASKDGSAVPENPFGPIIIYNDTQMVTWNNTSIFVLDLVNNCVLGSHNHVGNILSLSVNKDEIFVLRSGAHRNIIRIAQKPEAPPIVSPVSSVLADNRTRTPSSVPEYKHILQESMKSNPQRSQSVTNSPLTLHPTISERSASPVPFLPSNLFGKIKTTLEYASSAGLNSPQNFSGAAPDDKNLVRPTAHSATDIGIVASNSSTNGFDSSVSSQQTSVEIEDAVDASQLLTETVSEALPPVVELKQDEIDQVTIDLKLKIPEIEEIRVSPIQCESPELSTELFTDERKVSGSPNSQNGSAFREDRFSSLKGKHELAGELLVERRPKKKKKKKKRKAVSAPASEKKTDSDSGKSHDSVPLDTRETPSDSDTDHEKSPEPTKDLEEDYEIGVLPVNPAAADNEPNDSVDNTDTASGDAILDNEKLEISTEIAKEISTEMEIMHNSENLMNKSDIKPESESTISERPCELTVSTDQVDSIVHPLMTEPVLCSPDASGLNQTLDVSVDDFYAKYQKKSVKEQPTIDKIDPITEFQQKLRDNGNFNRATDEAISVDPLLTLLTDTWSAFPTPGYIQSISLSHKQAWVTDKNDRLYSSSLTEPGLTWKKEDDGAKLISVSDNGAILWKLLRNGSVYAAVRMLAGGPDSIAWQEVLKDVKYISVDNTCAWFIKNTGEIMLQTGLSKDRPFFTSTLVSCPCKLLHIKCRNDVVWGLTDEGKAIARVGVQPGCDEGTRWDEIECLPDGLGFCSFSLGGQNSAWALDIAGRLFFKTGVTSKAPVGDPHWWQISLSEYFIQDSSTIDNWTKSLAEFLDPQKLTKVLQGNQGGLVLASSNGIWVCPEQRTSFRVCRGMMTGHLWEVALLSGVALSMRWSHVCAQVAEGSLGIIWAQQPNGEILYMPLETKAFISVGTRHLHSPLLCISAAETAVWILTDAGKVFIRQGVNTRYPQGIGWVDLDLSQLGESKLVHLSIGAENVWAVDQSGVVYFRIGILAPSSQVLNQAWIIVDEKPSNGSYFAQVEVGPKDNMVWAIDDKKSVYMRRGVTDRMPLGQEWIHVPGTQAKQLSISNDTVWALSPSGDVLARFGITEDNEVGNYWKKIPGNFISISASANNNLWALNNEGQLCQRTTRCFIPQLSRDLATKKRARTVSQASSDGDWELL
ncbi:tectonin beta-propeller repeat-containing protein 2-like [Tubulanus polymorphus]|uniref:tectonin beta-propeller repeat-containing protein 2-like n=1 Tax=Tubulanus polymorphus TaxID=672921 RepID=UPI003DA5303A